MKPFQFGMMDLLWLPVALLPSYFFIRLGMPWRFVVASFFYQGCAITLGLFITREEKLYIQKAIWVVLVAWLTIIPVYILYH